MEPRTHLESSYRQIFSSYSCLLLNSEQYSRVGTFRQRRHLWVFRHVLVATALLPRVAFCWCRSCSLYPLRVASRPLFSLCVMPNSLVVGMFKMPVLIYFVPSTLGRISGIAQGVL